MRQLRQRAGAGAGLRRRRLQAGVGAGRPAYTGPSSRTAARAGDRR